MSDWRQQLEEVVEPAVARSRHIDRVLMDSSALQRAGEVFKRTFDAVPAFLVSDENTFAAAGENAKACLDAAGIATTSLVLPARPRLKPTMDLGEEIRRRCRAAPKNAVPVAVGAGVINDLVKYAAFMEGRPFFCIATAASMDGYASAGSPLVEAGFKHTIPCAPPRAILADLDVIAAAPAEMTGWGYGDLAGKMPAGGDWILADALGVEPVDDIAWPLVQNRLRDWLAEPESLRAGDAAATAGLFAGLTVTGLAMEFHGSSRPASGADHQIAHLWEMENLSHQGIPVSHGACVAIGCLTTLALFDWLVEQDLTNLDAEKIVAGAASMETTAAAIHAAFPNRVVAERALEESAAKQLSEEARGGRVKQIADIWPKLRQRLRAHLMSRQEMVRLLVAAGAPTQAAEIGLSPEHHRETIARARFLRRRYTVLDFLAEVDLLQDATEAIFKRGLLH